MEKARINHSRINGKIWKLICIVLVIGSILAAIKSIFVGLQWDEEYAVSLAYRLAKGDRLFTQIWDPHQTSAFLMQIFIWIYIKIFHTTTYLVIFLRVVGVLFQMFVTYRFYRLISSFICKDKSFLCAILFFNLSAKTFVIPEFSNIMVWGLTLMLIELTNLAILQGRIGIKENIVRDEEVVWNWHMTITVLLAGIYLSIVVLAYPSCVILFPFIVVYLLKYDRKKYISVGIITLVCALLGILYVTYLLSYTTVHELFVNIQNILLSNGAHSDSIFIKIKNYGLDLCIGCLFMAIFTVIAYVIQRVFLKKKEKTVLFFMVMAVAFSYQILCWILMLWEYEKSYMYAIYVFILAVVCYCLRRFTKAEKEVGVLWIGASITMYFAILLLTNLNLYTSVKYLFPGTIIAVILMIRYIDRTDMADTVTRSGITVCIVLWCLASIFIKGWEYTYNEGLMQNISRIGNVISYGAGKGIFTEYIQAYVQDSEYEEFQLYIQPGDNLLVIDPRTLCYLYADVNIATGSTISTPTFDENMLVYWKQNPDKYPDVIAIQCWYGEVIEAPEYEWIYNWINTKYNAIEVIDGKYYRYYINRH